MSDVPQSGQSNRHLASLFSRKNQSNVIQSDSRWAQADIERPTNVHDFINFIIFRIKLCIFHFSAFFWSSQFHSVISLFLFIFHNSNKINTTQYFFFESFSASVACVVVAFFSHKLHALSHSKKNVTFHVAVLFSRARSTRRRLKCGDYNT